MNPTSTATSRLTPDQVNHFRREGYVIYKQPVFSEERFIALRECFEGLLEQQIRDGARPEAMDKPHFLEPRLFDWVFSDEILDLVEPLIGPDILLFATHFICKPAGDGKRVPWHEDSAYWKGILEPMEAVTVWLAIDDSTQENGCMWVVPKSHDTGRSGFSDYEGVDAEQSVFPTEIIKPQQRAENAVPVELEANEASLHESKMIHGSQPNTSQKRRTGFTMRFLPGHVRLQPEWEDRLRLYLARGQDRAGNNLADPTRAYPELFDAAKTGRKVH